MLLSEYQRTEWFSPDVKPLIPGFYMCRKSPGGFDCLRKFDGNVWLSPMDDKSPSSVSMEWQGVVPDSIDVSLYPTALRTLVLAHRGHAQYAKEGKVAPSETHAVAIGVLYS